MNRLLLLAQTTTLLFPTPSQSDTNHFGTGGVFELDLGDNEISLGHIVITIINNIANLLSI